MINYGAGTEAQSLQPEYPYAASMLPVRLYALILYEYVLPDVRPESYLDSLFPAILPISVHVLPDEQEPGFRQISKPFSSLLASVHSTFILPALIRGVADIFVG